MSLSRIVALAALLTLTACATMNDAISSKKQGTEKLYAKSCDAVWPLSVRVLRDNNAGAIEERKSENQMLANSSAGLFSFGTFMVVWLEPAAADKCNVTIVTKRKISTNVITDLTETGYHDQLSNLVATAT